MTLRGKTALILGASSGVGWATVMALRTEQVRVFGIARRGAALADLRAGLREPLETLSADATDSATTLRLLRDLRPELVVLSAGARPHMAPITEQTWETFSEPWNSDVQAAFHLVKAALTVPLAPGSVVVLISSGAAINGSALSGGYAGAKRMQWFLSGYAEQLSLKRKLGIRFLTVVPGQMIEGTEIGEGAAEAYGAWQGITKEEVMKRFERPLDVQQVAAAIVLGLRGDVAPGVTAIKVTGLGIEALG